MTKVFTFPYDERRISPNVALLNIFVLDVINLLYTVYVYPSQTSGLGFFDKL